MKKIIKNITICATIALLVVFSIVTYQLIRISSLKRTETQLDARLAELQAMEVSLSDGIALRQTDAYKQREIRESLGMIKGDEKIIIVR